MSVFLDEESKKCAAAVTRKKAFSLSLSELALVARWPLTRANYLIRVTKVKYHV